MAGLPFHGVTDDVHFRVAVGGGSDRDGPFQLRCTVGVTCDQPLGHASLRQSSGDPPADFAGAPGDRQVGWVLNTLAEGRGYLLSCPRMAPAGNTVLWMFT